jgi:hypothetical protein
VKEVLIEGRRIWVVDQANLSGVRCYLDDQLQPFAGHGRINIHKTGDVAAGVREVLNEPASYWVCDQHKDHRYGRRQLAQCANCRGTVNDDKVGLEFEDFLGKKPRPIRVTCGPAIIQLEIAALDPTELAEAIFQGLYAGSRFGIAFTDPPSGRQFAPSARTAVRGPPAAMPRMRQREAR